MSRADDLLDPPGYTALLACDASSGRPTSRDSVFVPRPLAVELNNIRVALDSASPAEAFTRAAAPIPRRLLDKATRRLVLAAIGTVAAAEEHKSIERDDEERLQRERSLAQRAVIDAYPAPQPEADAKPEPAPEATVPEPDDVAPEGCYAEVIHTDSFEQKLVKLLRLESSGGTRNTPEAVDLRAVKAIADRGPERLVKLIAGWRSALEQLACEMPNFAHVIERITRQCMLAVETGTPLRIAPILLVGGPGVGKSYFAQRLAKVLELPSYTYNMESAESTSVLLGSEKHWSSADPGVLYQFVVAGEVANPLVVLDEIEKAPAGLRGHYRPRDGLIPLLERSTSQNLRDKCSEIGFDGSFVVYVATANQLSRIETPILSRFDIQLVRDLTPQQAVGVVRAMHESIKRELRLESFARPAPELVRELAMLANPRLIGRLLREAFARAVERGTTRLTPEDLLQSGSAGPRIH